MPEIIKASEQNLNAVFSDAYLFEIPLYQRPYAWTMEQVDELQDDLLSAMDRDAQSPYFLGSIVLIKNEGDSRSAVVDGQQRLTTLSMLFCVLRELAAGDAQSELDGFVREAGNSLRGTQDRFRLSLRARDRDFFWELYTILPSLVVTPCPCLLTTVGLSCVGGRAFHAPAMSNCGW